MLEDLYPVRWAGDQAVVTLPPHIGVSNAGQVREELLSVINRGAATLIADMTATISCDHAGADAVIRAWQRAAASGSELRLVVTARNVSRVLDLRGLDRQVSVYPSLEAATAARLPAEAAVPVTARRRQARAGRAGQPTDGTWVASLLPGELLEALQDATALTDGAGTILAASARLEAMFGYGPGEVLGLPAETLVPAGLQEADGSDPARAGSPLTRPTGRGAELAGLRKDGTMFQVLVSLTPVTTAYSQLTIVVFRDPTWTGRLDDLLALARDAAATRQEHLRLLDAVISGLFHAGLSLQTALSLPADTARQCAETVVGELDDIIRHIRGTAFAQDGRSSHGPPLLRAPVPTPCPRE